MDLGDGFKFHGRHIKPDEWLCTNPKCQKECTDPRGYYVFAGNDECNRCHCKKPKKPKFYKDSAAAAKLSSPAGGGGAKSGGKSPDNGGGSAAETKQDKELRELQQKDKQREIDRLKKKLNTPDADGMEVDEASGGESGSSTEDLEHAMQQSEDLLKFWQGKLKDHKKGTPLHSKAQQSHDEAKEEFEKARQAVWDSKDPHEQMSKKTAKADRLNRLVATLEGELLEQMQEKAAAEKLAEEYQTKVDATIQRIEETKALRQRLHEESQSIREKVVGASPEGIGGLVEKQCKSTLSMFDDPLLKDDESVKAKRPDVVHLTNAIADALSKLAEITATVGVGLDAAKAKATNDAAAATAEAKAKHKTVADATKAADVIKTRTAASSSSSVTPERSFLDAAMAKPLEERTGDELVLTGKAGKVRKTDAVADDLDLANV